MAAHGRIEEARQALRSFGIEANAAGLARLTNQRGSYREMFLSRIAAVRPDQSAPAALPYCDPRWVRCALHGHSGTGPPVDAGGRLLRFSFFSWLGPAVLTWVWSSELASWALTRLL